MRRTRTKNKLKANQCLIDGCSEDVEIRGVCQYHYRQFLQARRRLLTKRAREQFDREQVAAGLIAASRQGRTPRQVNPYVKTA